MLDNVQNRVPYEVQDQVRVLVGGPTHTISDWRIRPWEGGHRLGVIPK